MLYGESFANIKEFFKEIWMKRGITILRWKKPRNGPNPRRTKEKNVHFLFHDISLRWALGAANGGVNGLIIIGGKGEGGIGGGMVGVAEGVGPIN